ncbi:MAG: bifunctional 5,10-methylenetetrahydrofolate dehydrogenase/5,10-methenyltetrahydrofolate cyclohydrolase [Bdellovibrionota bacterium]|nr:MAG: bifunctional 5,10-methylenetetrahydrofolate dehydrogenase/5,10-methenyltetrahydrofolate cyclohydrolase [Bdellovibrionota bacterium]
MATNPYILDGKALAATFHGYLRAKSNEVAAKLGRPPGLGVILVGDNPASRTYVANKEKTAIACGLHTADHKLAAAARFDEVQEAINDFNAREDIDGILLQLPLPGSLDSKKLIPMIRPDKDADGLHPFNQGLLMSGSGGIKPCTPLGTMYLLDMAMAGGCASIEQLPAADLSGLRAIVVGRSILVGKPVGMLLLERNATVTYAHSKTPELPQRCAEADILVAAVGRAELVRKEWIKPGAIVLDVGINRTADGKLVGDVAFAEGCERARAITPVPGGVGPMTVAMLIRNTVQCCVDRHGLAIRI